MSTCLFDSRQPLLPHVVDGRPDLREQVQVRPDQRRRTLEPTEAFGEEGKLFVGLRGQLEVERHRGNGPLEGRPEHVGLGGVEGARVVGEDVHLRERRFVVGVAPERAHAFCEVRTLVERHRRAPAHAGGGWARVDPLEVLGSDGRARRRQQEPCKVAGERGVGADRRCRPGSLSTENRHAAILGYA